MPIRMAVINKQKINPVERTLGTVAENERWAPVMPHTRVGPQKIRS